MYNRPPETSRYGSFGSDMLHRLPGSGTIAPVRAG
jgi:hypothetical protein